jgi:hypothetical protein
MPLRLLPSSTVGSVCLEVAWPAILLPGSTSPSPAVSCALQQESRSACRADIRRYPDCHTHEA